MWSSQTVFCWDKTPTFSLGCFCSATQISSRTNCWRAKTPINRFLDDNAYAPAYDTIPSTSLKRKALKPEVWLETGKRQASWQLQPLRKILVDVFTPNRELTW